MNTCENNDCPVNIMQSVKFCKRHSNINRNVAPKPQRKASSKKMYQKRIHGFFGADGKVRANMGLARVKEQDRLAWEMRQAEMAKGAICGFMAILQLVS